MTSQHNTGTHPFYIGMYIHICTHIYVHIYTSQKECLCIFSPIASATQCHLLCAPNWDQNSLLSNHHLPLPIPAMKHVERNHVLHPETPTLGRCFKKTNKWQPFCGSNSSEMLRSCCEFMMMLAPMATGSCNGAPAQI